MSKVIYASFGSSHDRAYKLYLEACKIDTKEFQKALDLYTEAVRLNPGFINAWINLGNMYFKLKRIDKAKECYEMALDKDSKSVYATYNLGYIAYYARNYELAEKYFTYALELDPNFEDARINLETILEQNNK